MKKILFVISGLGAGGAEKVVAQLARHWAAKGYAICIACFDPPEENTYHDFPQAIDIRRLGAEWSILRRGRLAKLADFLALRDLFRREQPDAVFAFLTKNIALSLIAAAGSDVKIVCCERNNPKCQQMHRLWDALLNRAYRRADMVICQTQAVTRCIPKAARDRVRVIPNPIGKWPIVPERGSAGTIVTVGRLTHQKGFDILLDSFAQVAKARGDWRLQIWGEGPDHEALAAQARDSGCADRVALMGLSDRPGSWLRDAALFVLPSRYEGFPNVLGEAMAAGLPVIAADCDFGPAEMIDHGVDGMLVAPEDPVALAAAMAQCMDDAELRERLGDEAARSIERFSPANVLREWDHALQEVAGSKTSAEAKLATRAMEAAQ